MAVKIKTKSGTIDIANDVISTVVYSVHVRAVARTWDALAESGGRCAGDI